MPTITWAGRIDPIKDLETLLRAFAAGPRASCRTPGCGIFGGTPPAAGLPRSAARQLAVDWARPGASPSRAGWSNIRDAYAAGNVVVLSSISEGFPYTLIEAMRPAGRPSPPTSAAWPRRSGTPAWSCRRANRRRWPRPAWGCCATTLLRHRLGAAARERALENFTVDQAIDTFDAIYERPCRRRSTGAGARDAAAPSRGPSPRGAIGMTVIGRALGPVLVGPAPRLVRRSPRSRTRTRCRRARRGMAPTCAPRPSTRSRSPPCSRRSRHHRRLARTRYGSPDVFDLADEMYRRTPCRPAEPPPRGRAVAGHCTAHLLRGLLFGLPALLSHAVAAPAHRRRPADGPDRLDAAVLGRRAGPRLPRYRPARRTTRPGRTACCGWGSGVRCRVARRARRHAPARTRAGAGAAVRRCPGRVSARRDGAPHRARQECWLLAATGARRRSRRGLPAVGMVRRRCRRCCGSRSSVSALRPPCSPPSDGGSGTGRPAGVRRGASCAARTARAVRAASSAGLLTFPVRACSDFGNGRGGAAVAILTLAAVAEHGRRRVEPVPLPPPRTRRCCSAAAPRAGSPGRPRRAAARRGGGYLEPPPHLLAATLAVGIAAGVRRSDVDGCCRAAVLPRPRRRAVRGAPAAGTGHRGCHGAGVRVRARRRGGAACWACPPAGPFPSFPPQLLVSACLFVGLLVRSCTVIARVDAHI